MEQIVNHVKLLEESWKELQEWAANCSFDPETEADIQCFLYHCLVKRLGTATSIHAESPHKEGISDLVIDNKVFVELNYILRSGERTEGSWKARTKNAKEEIEKLGELKKECSTITGVLAVFSKTYNEDDECWYDEIKKLCEKSGIIMLRPWKRKTER